MQARDSRRARKEGHRSGSKSRSVDADIVIQSRFANKRRGSPDVNKSFERLWAST
jgi:hypothetical protein